MLLLQFFKDALMSGNTVLAKEKIRVCVLSLVVSNACEKTLGIINLGRLLFTGAFHTLICSTS
jgi:hypothetical protein